MPKRIGKAGANLGELNKRLNEGLLDQGPVVGFHYSTGNEAFYRAVAGLAALLLNDERKMSKEVNYILKNGTKYRKPDGTVWVIFKAVDFAGYRICVGVTADPSHKYVLDQCPPDYLATPAPINKW